MRATQLAVTVTALLAACASTPEGPPQLEPAVVQKLEVLSQDFEGFTAAVHVKLPGAGAPGGITAKQATWELVVQDVRTAGGTAPLGQQPAGDPVVRLEARSPYGPEEKLAELLESKEPLPYLMRGAVELQDGRSLPFSVAGLVRSPRVPEIEIWHVEASAYYDTKEINLVFFPHIKNPNPFDVKLEELDYTLEIDGKKLIENGVTGRNEKVSASAAAQLEIPITLTEKNFPEVGKYLKSPAGLRYKLEGEVKLGLGALPFELEGPIVLGKSAPESFDEQAPARAKNEDELEVEN